MEDDMYIHEEEGKQQQPINYAQVVLFQIARVNNAGSNLNSIFSTKDNQAFINAANYSDAVEELESIVLHLVDDDYAKEVAELDTKFTGKFNVLVKNASTRFQVKVAEASVSIERSRAKLGAVMKLLNRRAFFPDRDARGVV